MANIGTALAGKVLIGAGNGASATFASIGTNSGLAAHGVVIAEGNNAFSVTSSGSLGQVLTSNGAGSDPTFQTPATGFSWTDVTGATQTFAASNGYITDRGGGVTYTLPASGTLGDTIKIVGKSGIATITPNANQQILIGSVSGSVGVTGTCVATNAGDCIELICTTSGASTVWRADSVIGNWVLS